ncbi:MAG: hypothetical protein Q7W02_03235 [Candidatus Rokubacteria bacterium]|nr:hypothetical protein [Candidatus Rokubacteria bacterium]
MIVQIRFPAACLALAAALAAVPSAVAQVSKPPRDPVLIQRKLQQSAALQREALQTLKDPGQAERLVKNAWTELKSAKDDMVINASNMQFPDPLFNTNNGRAEQALALLLGCWDTLKLRDKWTDPSKEIAGVRGRLQQSLGLTNTVAATTF